MGNIFSICIEPQNEKTKNIEKDKKIQKNVYKDKDKNLTEYYLISKFLFHM